MRRIALACVLLTVALVLVGTTVSTFGSRSQTGRGAAAAVATKRVFLIIGENTSAGQITPRHAPFMTGVLKPVATWLLSYHSFTKSSSLGDYVAMTSGQYTKCEAGDDLPASCHQSVDNLFQQLGRSGRSWFVFDESAANPCDIADHGAAWSRNIYSAHHDPALYYTGLHGKVYDEAVAPRAACRTHDLPMGTTAPNDVSALDGALSSGRVGNLNVLIPNDCENGHDPCGGRDPIRAFDDFVARVVPKIQHSPAYGADSTIVITWDEGGDPPLDPGHPLLIAVGPRVQHRVVKAGAYTHYSLLKTLEGVFALPPLGHARTAQALPLFR
jgi:hypothetical protein